MASYGAAEDYAQYKNREVDPRQVLGGKGQRGGPLKPGSDDEREEKEEQKNLPAIFKKERHP